MKILICTGIYPPRIGGPAQYAKRLEDELVAQGHEVKVLTYVFENKLPPLIRHKLFFLRTLFCMKGVRLIIALDTFSVGFPAVCAARLFGKKIIIRTGGDFLWESYVERTKEDVLLKDFYKTSLKKLSLKERLIFLVTRFTLQNVDAVAFSTVWQKNIFTNAYRLDEKKNFVIENEYPPKVGDFPAKSKTYLWAGRMIFLKNIQRLKNAFENAKKKDSTINLDTVTDLSKEELLERMKNCYAIILPSLTDISPNFILDAIALGKPCIVTCETGISDRIEGRVLFLDPLSEKDIEEKILFLADDKNHQDLLASVKSFDFVHTMKDIAAEFLKIKS